mgnify:CR=1|tara:strand:+ start:240 stop:374 length:135 start_codon:yes stop_codon:yes gene_type:complete
MDTGCNTIRTLGLQMTALKDETRFISVSNDLQIAALIVDRFLKG